MSSDTSKMVATMWSRRVEDFHRSGLTQRQYCVQHGLKSSSLQRWVEKFKKEISKSGNKTSRPKSSRPRVQRGFSKVIPSSVNNVPSSSVFVLHFPNGLMLECQDLPSSEWFKNIGGLS